MERRVLTLEHLQYLGQFLALDRILRLNGHRNNGLRKLDRGQFDHISCIAKRVASDRVTRANAAGDIAALKRFDLALPFAFRCMDLPELGNVFLLVAVRVVHSRIRFQLT